MHTHAWIPFVAIVYGVSAQGITPRVLAGGKYCHEVTLTGTWTVDAPAGESLLGEFREGSGNLEYRWAGPGAVLVSFYALHYEGIRQSRVYSAKKIWLPLKPANASRAATEHQWKGAGPVIGSRTPALSAPPAVPPGQDGIIRFRGFEFAATAHLYDPPFAASPGGDWLATLSWKGRIPSEFNFERSHGSMYLDVYHVASGEKTIQVQLDFRDTEPQDILPHAVWISDRHFVFPINRLKTRLMVCDLGPLQGGFEPVWDIPSKDSEILGFREETTTDDVAGTLAQLTLHVGVRVAEAGKYRLTATIENEHGNSTSRSQDAELSAGINQIKYGVDIPHDADGVLKVRNVTLERVIGQAGTQVARRDYLGTIGPYRLITHQWEPRRKALDTLNHAGRSTAVKSPATVPSPLTIRSLPGKVENLTGLPKAGGKLDTLRFRVAVPPVAGQCTWFTTLESGGGSLTSASPQVNSQTPPETILFEFQTKSIFTEAPDGEVRLSGVTVLCRDEKTSWFHSFDQFPGYVIPGLRLSMLQHGTPGFATFTGKNRVEFLDTNHDGKYEAIKVTLGFKSDRKCKIMPTFKDSNGSRFQIGQALYDPRDSSQGVVFYVAFGHISTSGEHSLEEFNVLCEASDGLFRSAVYDKSYRLPLGNFASDQFQTPFELSFESEQPALEDGMFVYRINCAPRWTLDLPLEFSIMQGVPGAAIALDPPSGGCKEHATALRFKALPDTPPFVYDIAVAGTIANGWVSNFVSTKWVKAGVPEIRGVLPNSGSGKRAMFRVAADDLSTGVPKIELLFSGSDEIAHACHITITHLAIALTNDDGHAAKMSKYPEWPSIENSQCAIEKGYYGGDVPVSFKPAFNGRKSVYARAWNGAGATTGWIKEGAWTVSQNEPPVPIAASPNSGITNHQVFTFTFADPNGATDIEKIEAIVAFDPSDEQACHLIVDRGAALVSLTGGNSVSLGSTGTLASPQCAITNVQVVEERGRMLRLSASIRFMTAFRGRRNIFLKSGDRSKLESGWLWAGSWDIR